MAEPMEPSKGAAGTQSSKPTLGEATDTEPTGDATDSPYSGRPDWQGEDLKIEPDGLPAPLKWRPVFMWRALIFGFLFDLAAEILLQQLGKQLLTVYSFFHAAIVGAIVGIVAPSIGRAAGVWWANRTLRKARATTPHKEGVA